MRTPVSYTHLQNIDFFDVLLVDGFDKDGQPSQLCSIEFYDRCHSALRAGGILVVNLCADDAGCSLCIGRINDSFAGKTLVVDADEGENKIVFARKDAAFPPTFSELTERLRALEPHHPVDLDKTAQKILGRGQAHGNTPVSYTHLDVYKRQALVSQPKKNGHNDHKGKNQSGSL